jgi:RNA polymerase subunit RPABC4/transcription elongation factor Spt4
MIVLVILAIVAAFLICLYVYDVGSRRICPRCGSRKAAAHLGYLPTGLFFHCRNCGAVFDGDGVLLDRNSN